MDSELKRVIYVSEKTDFSETCLNSIIDSSERNNPKDLVTGSLLSGSNSFLQLVEGPPLSVDNLFLKISKDNRHKNIVKLCDEMIRDRLFSSWSMKHMPFNNLEWSGGSLDAGNFLELTPNEAVNIFTRINEYGNL